MRKLSVATLLFGSTVCLGTAHGFIGGTSEATPTGGICSPVSGLACDPNLPAASSCPPGELCIPIRFEQDGTTGEASAVQSAAYDCKERGSTRNCPFCSTNEDSLLVLVNEHSAANYLCACVILFDGHENIIGAGVTLLSERDNDTINLCTALSTVFGATGAAKPQSGTVEVVTTNVTALPAACGNPAIPQGPPQGGAYAWIKNVMYKGNPTQKTIQADPYTSNNAMGVAKSDLRITPKGVADAAALYGSFCFFGPAGLVQPFPASVYMPGTFE